LVHWTCGEINSCTGWLREGRTGEVGRSTKERIIAQQEGLSISALTMARWLGGIETETHDQGSSSFFSSSVHGITHNCINKNTPSSSCCSGEITLDPTMTTIAANAFDGCSNLTGSLTLPSSVTVIGNYAFRGCTGFTGSLTIPSSVTTIGNFAFEICFGFTGSLTLATPSSLTSIGNDAFSHCSGFTGSLTIPSSVTSIGDFAFYDCSGFTGSLTLPSSVTTIGGKAFRNSAGFTSAVTFPNSVTSLASDAFSYNRCNWISCCDSCGLTGAQMCLCDSSCNGVCQTTFFPTQQPTLLPSSSPSISSLPSVSPSSLPSVSPSSVPSVSPSSLPSVSPTSHPTILRPPLFGFGVKISDVAILSSGKAILVDYLRDAKRGEIFPCLRSLLLTSLSLSPVLLCFLFQARCFPSLASSTPLKSPQLPTLPCPLIPFSSSGVPCQ
jgi:hypothetical protein